MGIKEKDKLSKLVKFYDQRHDLNKVKEKTKQMSRTDKEVGTYAKMAGYNID
jgi:hypothetical protein